MKNLAIGGCLVVVFLLALSVSGSAQVSRQYAAHVPFDFSVGNKLVEAGDYTIGPASGITNQRALVLRSRSTGKGEIVGMVVIGPSQSDAPGTMTFVKDSDRWTLSAINTSAFTLKLINLKKIKPGETLSASANNARETHTIMLRN